MVLRVLYTLIDTSLQKGLPISLVLFPNRKQVPTQIILYLSLIQPSRASVLFLIPIIGFGQLQMMHLMGFTSPRRLWKKFKLKQF